MTRKLVRRDTQIIKSSILSLAVSYIAFYYLMPALLALSGLLAAALFTAILWMSVRSVARLMIMVIGVVRLGPSYGNKLVESLGMELRGMRRYAQFAQRFSAR